MKKYKFVLLLNILVSFNLFSQNSLFSYKNVIGKYSNNSLLGTSALYKKGSGLCEIEESTLLLSYSNLYSIPQLWGADISYVSRQKIGVLPLSVSVLGPSEFCKLKTLLGYSLPIFKDIYLGLNLTSNYYLIKNNKNKLFFGFNFNVNYKYQNKLNFGFSLNLPQLIQFTKITNTSFKQTILEFSVLYAFARNSALSVAIAKNIENKIDVTFLSIIKLNRILISTIGYNTNKNEVFVNLNLNLNKFTIALTSIYNFNLGFSPEVSFLF